MPHTYTITFTVRSEVEMTPQEAVAFVLDLDLIKNNPEKYFDDKGHCVAQIHSVEVK